MDEKKKSFLMYNDFIHTVNHLTDEQAGKLLKHILEYVNDNNSVLEDQILIIAFEPIKQQIIRDSKKYDMYIEKQRENGKKGGRPNKTNLFDENQKNQAFNENPSQSKKADNDNVNVIVNDTVIDSKEKKVVVRKRNNCSSKGEETFMDIIPPELLSVENFRETWFAWEKERIRQKKPLTQKAAEIQFKNLILWMNSGRGQPTKILENSIAGQWQGLFEIKSNNTKQLQREKKYEELK